MRLRDLAATVATWAAAEHLIRRVYLFGSRVKGTERPDSDLDVLVVHDIDPKQRGICDTLHLDRQSTCLDHAPRWRADLGRFPYHCT